MCWPLNSCLILYNPHINYQTLYLICSKYCLVIEFAAALYLLTVCGFVFVLFIILTGLGICKFFCIECKFGHVNELVHNCLWSVETKRRKLYVYSLTPVSLANILLWSSLALMKRFIDISKFWSKQYAIYIFQTRLIDIKYIDYLFYFLSFKSESNIKIVQDSNPINKLILTFDACGI